MREVARASHTPQVAPSVPQHKPMPTQVAPSQDAQVQVFTPMTHIHGVAAQAVDALRGPAQSAASIPGLLSNLWSAFGGMSGSQKDTASNPPPRRVGQHQPSYGNTLPFTPPGRDGNVPTGESTQVPRSQVHQAPQASGSGAQGTSTSGNATTSAMPGGTAAPNLGNPVTHALVMGMQQLQIMQLQQLQGKDHDAPEVVKPGVVDLPKLAPPDPSTGSLDFQDWLQLVTGLMGDLSDTLQAWWSGVVQVSRCAYDQWVVASPIDRLSVEPDDRLELVEGKWGQMG